MPKKPPSDFYQKAAKRLKGRVPQLAKLARKKHHTAAEKRQITYWNNVAQQVALPVADRPDRLKKFVWPAERRIPEKVYRKEARRIAKYTTNPKAMRDIAASKKALTNAQKAIIRKKMDLLRNTENVRSVTAKQAKKLPKQALVGKGVNAIRLQNTDKNARITSVSKDKMTVVSGGRKWVYLAVGSAEDKLAYAAENAFDKGASEVWIWTVNGRAGAGAEDLEEFLYELSNSYMKYIQQSIEKGLNADWLLGIAYTVD